MFVPLYYRRFIKTEGAEDPSNHPELRWRYIKHGSKPRRRRGARRTTPRSAAQTGPDTCMARRTASYLNAQQGQEDQERQERPAQTERSCRYQPGSLRQHCPPSHRPTSEQWPAPAQCHRLLASVRHRLDRSAQTDEAGALRRCRDRCLLQQSQSQELELLTAVPLLLQLQTFQLRPPEHESARGNRTDST